VFSGAYAINPVNDAKIPIWLADYVLISYGTGAIMAVPAHDERDWQFAKMFGLPIVQVVSEKNGTGDQGLGTGDCNSDNDIANEVYPNSPNSNPRSPIPDPRSPSSLQSPSTGEPTECTVAEGFSVNSGQFTGLPTAEAKKRITDWLEERGIGKRAINYKLRDWVFSRQRYWGEPIPVVHCEQCAAEHGSAIVPLPENELPLKLPEVTSYVPTGTGESPLAGIDQWVNTKCPKCGGPARRETNTMPQWAGSCWYYLRYLDPKNASAFAAKEKIDYWMPVDLYVGGAEHAVLHLLYSRFWHKVLYDLGIVNTLEPFQRLINQGMILGEDNQKMSKSQGNVINPDDIIKNYGADAMRVYEMFMGPLEVSKPWVTAGLVGVSRFLERLWAISEKPLCETAGDIALQKTLHRTIKKVSEDTKNINLNTAISAMMIYSNELAKLAVIPRKLWEPLVIMLSVYAPYLGEELWEKLGHTGSITACSWPVYDEELTHYDKVTIVVQVNGKIRYKFTVATGTPKDQLEQTALALPGIAKWLEGHTIVKVICVQDKLVNIVVQ
jgi:leucyl-tRNA synthetase